MGISLFLLENKRLLVWYADMPSSQNIRCFLASLTQSFRMVLSLALFFSVTCASVLGAQWKTYSPENSDGKTSPSKLSSIILLEPEQIISANFPDVAQFTDWTKQVTAICDDALAKEKNPPRMIVQITLRKNAAPVFELSGQPALGADFSKSLLAALARVRDMRPPLSSVSFRLDYAGTEMSQNADPLKRAESFVPVLVPPRQRELEAYHKSSIAEKYRLLRQWARDEALPLLSTGQRVDEKFVGVRNVGTMLARLSYDAPLDVEKLTFQNPDYWRGALEMVTGNHQVIAASVMLFVANGEIDKAVALFKLARPFTQPGVLATNLYDMLGEMGDSLIVDVNWEIKQGIALHDAGKYDAAIAAYQKLLAGYPCSAWARYELFLSQVAKSGGITSGVSHDSPNEDVDALWKKASREIYRADPLYDMQYIAERGESFGSMFDRFELGSLAKDRPKDYGEYYGRLARAMMNLGAYGYAAHAYFLTMPAKFVLKESSESKNSKDNLKELSLDDVLARFLYCLEKLGCTDLKKNFKDDFTPAFQKLDEEIEKHRKQ